MQDLYDRWDDVTHTGSDELVADNYMRNTLYYHPEGLDIIGGMQNVLDPYGDTWLNITSANGVPCRKDFYTQIVICIILLPV